MCNVENIPLLRIPLCVRHIKQTVEARQPADNKRFASGYILYDM